MRKPFSSQQRFDCQTIPEIQLNLKCRDEIIPLLRGLQHVYSQPQLRDEILDLVAADVNQHSRHDRGREGLDYWQVTVLAAARLGCNLDYDKLQDLAEQHRTLRHIMGIGDWESETGKKTAISVGDGFVTISASSNPKRWKPLATRLWRKRIGSIPRQRKKCVPIRSSWKPTSTIPPKVH